MATLKGRLLVATPLLGDPNFERTVVLLLEHNEDGALGVVLNRPSPLEVGDPLPEWRRFAPHPEVVFVGGPVSRTSVIALARVGGAAPEEAWRPVLDRIGVVDLGLDPDLIGGALDAVRVYAGYAGWDSGQLEAEILSGAWYVIDAEPGDVFTQDPDQLWRSVLARQPGDVARAALVPDDPSVN